MLSIFFSSIHYCWHTFSFSCPDSPTQRLPSSSFKQTAVWPANAPVTHFSKVSNPPHRPRIFDTAKKSPECTSSGLMVTRQGWGRFSNVAPMWFFRKSKLALWPQAVLENRGKTSIKESKVPSIPDGMRNTEMPCCFTCSMVSESFTLIWWSCQKKGPNKTKQ